MCNILVLVSDAFAGIFKGIDTPLAFVIVRAANFLVFSVSYALAPLFTDYMTAFIGQKAKISKRIVHIMYAMCGFTVLLVIVSQFTNMYYGFEEPNMYQRQSLFWLSQALGIFFLLINTAVIIRYIDLCDKNPQAQKALLTFSEYLRVNMDSLSQTQPIPLETELRHVKHYLSLEQLRFEEKLHVKYDIGVTDFMLPVLSVQPIVENAVYHGLFKKGTGGTITILTEETDNRCHIIVTDNGVGFNPSEPPENDERSHDDRSHLGIKNVRSRLAAMCGGKLIICSSPNEGTTVVIEIPKQIKRQKSQKKKTNSPPF